MPPFEYQQLDQADEILAQLNSLVGMITRHFNHESVPPQMLKGIEEVQKLDENIKNFYWTLKGASYVVKEWSGKSKQAKVAQLASYKTKVAAAHITVKQTIMDWIAKSAP